VPRGEESEVSLPLQLTKRDDARTVRVRAAIGLQKQKADRFPRWGFVDNDLEEPAWYGHRMPVQRLQIRVEYRPGDNSHFPLVTGPAPYLRFENPPSSAIQAPALRSHVRQHERRFVGFSIPREIRGGREVPTIVTGMPIPVRRNCRHSRGHQSWILLEALR